MAQRFVEMFGEELQSKTGTLKTAEALAGKVVGVYFSAHWCPPCRGFTPILAESYSNSLVVKGFEVVFVSSDKDQSSFDEYFAEMPWKALPFEARAIKDRLSKTFKVKGIPTLVILADDGSVITTEGRSAIMKDLQGEDFPWKPKPFTEVIGTSFVGQGGASLSKEAIEGKVLGLYFSAHWCPPCRGFTPKLAAWYKSVSAKLPNFQIVFISSDRSQEAFDEYFAEMPWIALPWSDRKAKENLSSLFEVDGIPSFIIVDKDGAVINSSGRGIPDADPEGNEFPWRPKPLKDMAQDVDGIQEFASLVVLMEDADVKTASAVTTAMSAVAEEYVSKKGSDDEVLFFIGEASASGICRNIRRLLGEPVVLEKHEHPLKAVPDRQNWGCDGCDGGGEGTAYCCADCNFDFCEDCNAKAVDRTARPLTGALLNLDDEGAYYRGDGVDFTNAASIREFLKKFHAGALERMQV